MYNTKILLDKFIIVFIILLCSLLVSCKNLLHGDNENTFNETQQDNSEITTKRDIYPNASPDSLRGLLSINYSISPIYSSLFPEETRNFSLMGISREDFPFDVKTVIDSLSYEQNPVLEPSEIILKIYNIFKKDESEDTVSKKEIQNFLFNSIQKTRGRFCPLKVELYNLKELTVIPEGSLNGNPKLYDISLPDTIKVLEKRCLSRTEIETIELPMALRTIGDEVFANCTKLKTITIADTVSSLGKGTFKNCTNLKSITIGKRIRSIPESCFENCENLETIEIPGTITNIEKNAFKGCKNLKSVIFKNGQFTSLPESCFEGCNNLQEFEVPATVKTLGKAAFKGCFALRTINFKGAQVTDIPESCFEQCYSWQHDSYTVSSIGKNAFKYCQCVKSFKVLDTVTAIPDYCFYACCSAKNITLPQTIKSFGEYSFSNCISINTINIPAGITKIPTSCFQTCLMLEKVTLPSSIEVIGTSAFSGCSRLKSLIFNGSKLKSIGDYAFYSSGLTSVSLPSELKTVGEYAFMNNLNWTYVRKDPLTKVASSSFNKTVKFYK